MKFRKFFSFWASLGLLLLFVAQSCIKKNDPVEEDYIPGEDVGLTQSGLANIFDAVYDIASTFGDTGNQPLTILPPNVTFTYTDSLLTDGDGLEYTVFFGNIDTTTLLGGAQCTDERTRSGNIFITQSGYFSSPALKITVDMPDNAKSHYVGNGSDMVKFTGQLTIDKTSSRSFNISWPNGLAKYKTGKVPFEVKQTITFPSDLTPGIWGKSYTATGAFNGTTSTGKPFGSFIGITLLKKLESGCARTFVKGKMEIQKQNNEQTVTLDFDPDLNGKCDRIFKVSLIDGKSKTYKVN